MNHAQRVRFSQAVGYPDVGPGATPDPTGVATMEGVLALWSDFIEGPEVPDVLFYGRSLRAPSVSRATARIPAILVRLPSPKPTSMRRLIRTPS